MSLKEVYLGDTLLWKKPKLLKGKFTDDSTASDWWYMDKPWRGVKVDISAFVDSATKEFAINDIIVTPGFYMNEKIERIDNIGNYGNVSKTTGLVAGCSSLRSIDLSDFDTSKCTDLALMLAAGPSLTYLDLSNFDTSNLTTTGQLFQCDSGLVTVVLSGFNMNKVTYYGDMFSQCTSLKNVIGPIVGIGAAITYNANLDLSDCPLTPSSAMVFINGLATVSSTKTLTLKSSTYNSLTAEQIAVATSKGWTVASA